MKKLKIVIGVILVGAIIGILIGIRVFKKAENSVANVKSELTINGPQLVQEFETNEDSANSIYLGKIIEVSGTVNSITTDEQGINVYLKDNDAASGVMCSFDKAALDQTKLAQGQPIKIKGVCNGYLLDVVLNKCALSQN